MSSQKHILEIYREYQREIDVIKDETVLFVLTFIQRIGSTNIQQLMQHLGLSSRELFEICEKLRSAGFIQLKDSNDPSAHIELSQRGNDLLILVFGTESPKQVNLSLSNISTQKSQTLGAQQQTTRAYSGKEYLSRLTEEEWIDIWKRLRLFTYRNYRWITLRSGLDLDEVILDAIEDVYFGKRHLIPNISIVVFLCAVIRSKISHIWERERKKVSIDRLREEEMDSERFSSEVFDTIFDTLLEGQSSLRFQRVESDQQTVYNELVTRILETIQGDLVLTRIVQLLIETPDLRPKDIAQELSLSQEEVRKARRRLKRRLQKLRTEWLPTEAERKVQKRIAVEKQEPELSISEAEAEFVSSAPSDKLYDELRQMGLDPNQPLPEVVSHLIAKAF